jgi:hypothetical protein
MGTTVPNLVVEKETINFLPRLAMSHEPPSLCLLNKWDYRCKYELYNSRIADVNKEKVLLNYYFDIFI